MPQHAYTRSKRRCPQLDCARRLATLLRDRPYVRTFRISPIGD